MKRFRFPLETLLMLRRRKLERLEAELAGLQRRMADALEKAADLERRGAEARESVGSGARLRGADLRLIAASTQAMLQQARTSRDAARKLDREIEEGRTAVLQARRDAEALARLRDRSRDAWRRAVEKEEEGLAAELYLARRRRS